MKTLKLDLSYNLKTDEQKTFADLKGVGEYLIRTLVAVRYGDGMGRTDTRLWGTLMDRMGASENGAVEIEQGECLWLLDVVDWCLDHSKVPPLAASWVMTLVCELERVRDA